MCKARLLLTSPSGEKKLFNPCLGKQKNRGVGQQKTGTTCHTKLDHMTVHQLKLRVLQEFRYSGLGSGENLSLIHEGKPLDLDSAPLSEYNIKNRSQVQLVRKVTGG